MIQPDIDDICTTHIYILYYIYKCMYQYIKLIILMSADRGF